MEFKQKISKHVEGDYDFVQEILRIALDDNSFPTTMNVKKVTVKNNGYTNHFGRWRASYAEGKTYEQKLARNIKIWIARYVKKANNLRTTYVFEGSNADIAEWDTLDQIYSRLTEFGYHFYKDDFDKVPKNVWDKIEEKYGYDEREDLHAEFKEFVNILVPINKEKDRLKKEYVPLIIESLNEIFPKVDLTRTEEEIIGFISISAKREVDKKLTRLHSKVHQINGQKYYITKDKLDFKYVNVDELINIESHKLSQKQFEFYSELKKLIEDEITKKNHHPFTFNQSGKIINFNKRFFANKMRINESAFKKRLSRLRKI